MFMRESLWSTSPLIRKLEFLLVSMRVSSQAAHQAFKRIIDIYKTDVCFLGQDWSLPFKVTLTPTDVHNLWNPTGVHKLMDHKPVRNHEEKLSTKNQL